MDMGIFSVLLQAGLFTSAIVIYLIFFKKSTRKGSYRQAGWNYPLKLFVARLAVRRWKSTLPNRQLLDSPQPDQTDGFDAFTIKASAPDGSAILLAIRKLCGHKPLAEVQFFVKLSDGTCYRLPESSETSCCAWENASNGWSAGGLSIQVLEPQNRFRILFNGVLKRTSDGAVRHVKLNLIWASATRAVKHPEDWSNELAAEFLATEPFGDGTWTEALDKCINGGGSWSQFGAAQGRFISHDEDGRIEQNEYLRIRGVKERSWALSYNGLKRSVILAIATADGTAVHIQGLLYPDNNTQCISGSVRLPDYSVHSITSTDLELSEFCENTDELPKTQVLIVNANNRSLKIVLRVSKYGGSTLNGMNQEFGNTYRFVAAEINGEHGSGILELGSKRIDELAAPLVFKDRKLKWLDKIKIKAPVGYCVQFEDPAAACVEYVGGKGASLALLSSVQKDEGYCVPPGFCLTIKALEQFLQLNPKIKEAINQIEAAGAEYEEAVFKNTCNSAVDLFLSAEITGELKDAILSNLTMLREKAIDHKLSELRFAVRSSAVGEDSEALSAAGQNETVLGVTSDDDILRSILKCWASMFAFTSAYYRRQNGQPCYCGGAVVVQALVEARVAGVMFTRYPDAGDPTRILITANYGLGETVVSGSVEPDTVIIKRSADEKLSIAKIQVGTKTQKIVSSVSGLETEQVLENERNVSCLSETEMLKLAEIGIAQDGLWGAGRDIEWAINKDGEVYLLQARPITSLERWTEEELLHELDFPIMSDDELITFANTGEVLPKPLTALTYDMVIVPLERGVTSLIPNNGDGYDKSVVLTHNRTSIALYNSVYRRVPKEIDVNLRMIEISIHGHKVADDHILSTALHRRQPKSTDKLLSIISMLKNLIIAKKSMNDTLKSVPSMDIFTFDDVTKMFNSIAEREQDIFRYSHNHSITSVASSITQFIAMSVLLEGKSDFSPEQCNEISTLLSSGDVLSAEVPQGLAKLSQMLKDSGRNEEFRKQDPNTAMQWLKSNIPNVYDHVTTFLEQHGHRAIMEFDLSTKPWALAPEDLMKVLMQVVPNQESKETKTREDIIASLKAPQKPNTRKALNWILPFCQRTVRYREATKAHLILAVHKLRLAAIHLGKLMVQNWYLPHYELVFYFRVLELKNYIETRDPALLKKAMQRKQYYSNWSKLKFAELNKGWVQPLSQEGPRIYSDGDKKLNGTSVCSGEVVARACVVRDLSEIDQLRQGDVLITHATDIGWSPYFPLLTGIVTELGGLISHGAVIAREYGLPCIVGVGEATDVFKTGDIVRLSGNEGLIEKVSIEATAGT
ncbi:putative phosphoenolpyruvate synthase isoform X1 [Colias croceus]|uniref:putative phosphoenolpyruvate synthase isoform X1 n=1 Tax=Colias crocea TaxID=72248 RepID=UPI001E280950|nr:putative phosphoenolpyruvate synthase isoform X1 [Colias croceus]